MTSLNESVYTIFNQDIYKDIANLYKNGEFYQQNDELEGALISYSSCASMIHTILQINKDCGPKCTTAVTNRDDVTPNETIDSSKTPNSPNNVADIPLESSLSVTNNTNTPTLNVNQNSTPSIDASKMLSRQDPNTTNTPITFDFLEKLKASFFDTLENKYQTVLSRVEQLQKKLKEKKQTLKKNSNDEDDEEEWLQACTKIHPAIFKDGSKDCIFFKDLAGLQTQKDQIKKALIQPLIYENLYPKVGKGFLLYGPPGTGKTLLVKAAVNELQLEDENVRVLFFAPTGATLKGKYVGDTEKRIVEAYKCASLAACKCEKNNPGKKYISVIFIDEIDSIAGDRNKDDTGLMANSVNTLLQVIDGLESPANVATIGATNYPWQLDAAVLRRFDTQILLGLPDSPQIEKAMNLAFNKFIELKLSDWKAGCSKLQRYLQDDSTKEIQNKTPKKEIDACAKGCSSKSKTVNIYQTNPYNIFKYSYTDSDNLIRAISDELSSDTKYFSFSDVDKVMGLAKTLTATTSLEYTFYNPSKTIPELTTLKDSTDNKLLSNFYLSSINKPRNGKSFNSVLSQYYEKLNNLVIDKQIINTQDADWKTDKTVGIDQDKLKEFYQDFHISKFPEYPFIKKDNKTYYNSKLLFDLDPNLLIEDPNIKDVYIYCQTEYLLHIYNEHWHELIKLSNNSQLQQLKKAAAAEAADRAAAAKAEEEEEAKFEDAVDEQNGGNETVSDDRNDTVRARLLNESRGAASGSSALARLNKFKIDIKTATKASNPIIDIETINCLNLEDSQRKKIINTLLEKNLLKTTWLPGNIINSKKVDIIVSTERTVKSQTTKNVEYDNAIMSLGLGSYLKKELDYKINSYLCKSIKFISSARKHLEFYLKNINIIHKFESKRNIFDATVWGYKNNDPTEFRNSIVANILMKRLDDDLPDQIIENKSLQQCKNSPYFKNFMNGYINLSDFLKITHNKQCNIDIYWLFTNIRYLLNEPTIDNSDYKDKTNQIKLIFEAFFPQAGNDSSQTFTYLRGNDDEVQDLFDLYTSKEILNVFDSMDINVLLRANLGKLTESRDTLLNKLFKKFMNKIYDKVHEIYHQILEASGEQFEREIDGLGQTVAIKVVNRSIIELNQEQIDEFEQKTLYINEFFVEKIPFITNNVFNKYSYEKQLSIDLLKLVNRAKDNLDNTIEDQTKKNLATAILNYQSYLSIVLNILASTQNELCITSVPGKNNTDCYIDKYFAYLPAISGSYQGKSNDCFRSFVFCFYNIWKNNISQLQKSNDIKFEGFHDDNLKNTKSLTDTEAITRLGRRLTSTIYAYYLNSELNNLKCSKAAADIDSNSFQLIDSKENLSSLTKRTWIKNKPIFDITETAEEKEKCAEFFNVGKMQFSFVKNLNNSNSITEMKKKMKRTLVAIGCLDDSNAIVYNQNIKLFENKSTIPEVFEFLYECKLDVNNENYRGILKTKSFIKSSLISISNIMSKIFSSNKKPSMSEFKSFVKRIKKMNPDISVLHYVLRLTNSIGIVSPQTNNILWSKINNRIPKTELTSQTIDQIYESIWGNSPEKEEAQKQEHSKRFLVSNLTRFGLYTTGTTAGTVLYGCGATIMGVAVGTIAAVAVAAATLALLAYNIKQQYDLYGMKGVGIELVLAAGGGALGSGLGHIINQSYKGDGDINYQLGARKTLVEEKTQEMSRAPDHWLEAAQPERPKSFVIRERTQINNPDYSRIDAGIDSITQYTGPGVSAIGKFTIDVAKSAGSTAASILIKPIHIRIPGFGWAATPLSIIRYAMVFQSFKSLFKSLTGNNSTPSINESLIDSIGMYGNDDIIFDISTENSIEQYIKTIKLDNDVDNVNIKHDLISRAYLNAYIREMDKNALHSSNFSNLKKVIDMDFQYFDTPTLNTKMDKVTYNNPPSSKLENDTNKAIQKFQKKGTVCESYIIKFKQTEFGPEINKIISENQKKLKIIDILPDKIKIAASEQPQSYDPILGGMLTDYSENRLKFLEDFKNGKYNKKTG